MKIAKLVEIKQTVEHVMRDLYDSRNVAEKRLYTMAKLFNDELDRVIAEESKKAYTAETAAKFIIDFVDDKNTLPLTFSNQKKAQGGAQ